MDPWLGMTGAKQGQLPSLEGGTLLEATQYENYYGSG